MSFLFDGPTPLDALALGTVVHIGAGSGGVLDAYADLKVGRLLLVEGDPDTALDLQAAVSGRPGVEALPAAVACVAGPIDWHRYNLTSLNGPLDAAGLASVYPRLRALGTRRVGAVALDALLQAQRLADDGPHLLVLDVPGQEAALLASLPADLLRHFGWIVLRGRNALAGADAPNGGDSATTLQAEGFAAVGLSGSPEPLWPLSLWRFDETSYRLRSLREELVATERARGALEGQLAQLREEGERLQHALAEARAESAARQRQVEELTRAAEVMARDAQRSQSELEQQLAATAARVTALQSQADETARHWQSDAEAERAAHATALAALQQQVQQALADARTSAARLAEDAATRATLQQALDAERQAHEATRVGAREAQAAADAAAGASQAEFGAVREAAQRELEAERDAARSELAVERAALAQAIADLNQRQQQQVEDTARAAAGLAQAAAESDAARRALQAERDAHAQAVSDLKRQQQLHEEAAAGAAAGQTQLIAERDAARRELEAERAAHARTRDARQELQAQAQAASDAAKAKDAELAARVQAVRQELATQEAAHAKAAGELLQQLADMTQRAHQLQERVAQQDKARESQERQTAERVQAAKDDAHRANQAVALSLKLQMLRESDLKDLQGRYQGVLVQQRSQQELLTKLAQRLAVANQYFHELSDAQQLPPAPAVIPAAPGPRKRRIRAKPGHDPETAAS